MSTYERVQKMEIGGLPPGYEVSFHEIRGYDSPDKWFEVSFLGKRIGRPSGYGSVRDACRAAREHNEEQQRIPKGIQGSKDMGHSCSEEPSSTSRGESIS